MYKRQDYELKRTYKLTAFDNKTQGKLELFPVIQYNKLSALDYNFTPIIERQTIYKAKAWQPFVSASYSTLNYIGIGGEMCIRDRSGTGLRDGKFTIRFTEKNPKDRLSL